MSEVTYLEQFIVEGFGSIFGNDLFLGVFFIGMFLAFVVMMRGSIETKMVILIPAFVLGSIFINWMLALTLLVVAFFVVPGIQKLFQQ